MRRSPRRSRGTEPSGPLVATVPCRLDLRERFLPRIEAECGRAVEPVRSVTGRDRLLRREWLRENLDRRNPYVDPPNLRQADLLGRDGRTDAEERALRLTVTGIAAGMRNTG